MSHDYPQLDPRKAPRGQHLVPIPRFPSNHSIEDGFGRIVDVKQIPARLAAPDLEGLRLDHPP